MWIDEPLYESEILRPHAAVLPAPQKLTGGLFAGTLSPTCLHILPECPCIVLGDLGGGGGYSEPGGQQKCT